VILPPVADLANDPTILHLIEACCPHGIRAFLQRMLESGRLQVCTAPLAGWSPDFTVFSDAAGPSAVLTGFHWFERPYPHRGPALSSLHFADATRVTSRRHTELWQTAHDIGPGVWSILSKARPRGMAVAAGPG
jgi:hypothetical protein